MFSFLSKVDTIVSLLHKLLWNIGGSRVLVRTRGGQIVYNFCGSRRNTFVDVLHCVADGVKCIALCYGSQNWRNVENVKKCGKRGRNVDSNKKHIGGEL